MADKIGRIIQCRQAFSLTAAGTVGSLVTEFIQIPVKGIITEIQPHYPSGTNQLVGLLVKIGSKQIWPYEGSLALDNITPQYACHEAVNNYEYLAITANNGDAANSHKVAIVITITEILQ